METKHDILPQNILKFDLGSLKMAISCYICARKSNSTIIINEFIIR